MNERISQDNLKGAMLEKIDEFIKEKSIQDTEPPTVSTKSVGLLQTKIIGRKPDTAREGEARPKGSAGGTPAPRTILAPELVEAQK